MAVLGGFNSFGKADFGKAAGGAGLCSFASAGARLVVFRYSFGKKTLAVQSSFGRAWCFGKRAAEIKLKL